MRITITLVSFAFVCMWACKHEPIMPDQPITTTTSTSSSGGNDSVCFNTQILPLFISHCAHAGCHDATTQTKGYNFTTYSGIRSGVRPFRPDDGKIMDALTETDADKRMPPAGALDNASINLIRKWIAEGALDRNCVNSCDTQNVTYQNQIQTVVQDYCVGCHSNQAPLLITYDNVKAAVQTPGKLLCAIKHAGCSPMPKGGNKLSDCQIRMVEIWLDAGCPQ